jgi:transcriptional regulator with XRE-family HTH domain
MNQKVEGITGEYRELTAKEIGDFVRLCRGIRGFKRLSLAQKAGISEKSLERLESGVRVSKEVYQKVAVALGQREDAFIGARYIRTLEEATLAVADTLEAWNDKHVEIEACSFSDERDMRRVLDCWGALLFDDSQLKTDALDAAASFKQNLTDWKDIFGDIDEPGRLNAQRALLEEVRTIEGLGYVARFGTYDAEFATGAQWTKMPIAVITFFQRTDWEKVAMKEMVVPRRFGNLTR